MTGASAVRLTGGYATMEFAELVDYFLWFFTSSSTAVQTMFGSVRIIEAVTSASERTAISDTH
jgi:hypothetical protein